MILIDDTLKLMPEVLRQVLKIEMKTWLIHSNYSSEHAHMLMINLSYDNI